jgi:hypothetical protein
LNLTYVAKKAKNGKNNFIYFCMGAHKGMDEEKKKKPCFDASKYGR